jgi:hypothetical protein
MRYPVAQSIGESTSGAGDHVLAKHRRTDIIVEQRIDDPLPHQPQQQERTFQ